MATRTTILGIAGSLRTGSYNRAALRAAQSLVPADAALEMMELNGISPFNQDDERNPSPAVQELKRRIRAADAILFVTPEYNDSVPGVLKNATDWASRPYGDRRGKVKPWLSWVHRSACSALRGRSITCAKCLSFSTCMR